MIKAQDEPTGIPQFKHPVKPKLHSLMIETVENGFICYENEKPNYRSPDCSISNRQVFNTKEQLFDYIDKNFE